MKPDETREKTTIWIDKELTPRYSPTGWPEREFWPEGTEKFEDNKRSLEKAKADSVPFLTMNGFLHESIDPDSLKPDTFIDVEIGKVEVVEEMFMSNPPRPTGRKIARVKKQENAAHVYTEGSEIDPDRYVGYCPKCNAAIKTNIQGNEIGKHDCKPNGIPLWIIEYNDKQYTSGAGKAIKILIDQLAAANKRIAELEQWQQEELYVWGPILDYCQNDKNAKRLGIGLGQSISKRVLEILKGIK
jgi:hypothetical protein